MLETPVWDEGVWIQQRITIARTACTWTKKEQVGWRAYFGTYHRNLPEEVFQDWQHALGAWEIGEEKRVLAAGVEAARVKACKIIKKRKTALDFEPLAFEACLAAFGPEGGRFRQGSEWAPKAWEKVDKVERRQLLEKWEHAETLLPVYYEYARQSVTLLQLAVMGVEVQQWRLNRLRRPERPAANAGTPLHPLAAEVNAGITRWHSRIGGHAEAIMVNLGKFLARDVPYTKIPLHERKWAAAIVLDSNAEHDAAGPWLSDAGPVSDPWVAAQVKRDEVRLASTNEATCPVDILHRVISKEQGGETRVREDVIRYDNALFATTSEGLSHDYKNDRKTHSRAIDENGGEVLAIRVNWKDTRNAELAEAFLRLIKELRPTKEKQTKRYRFFPKADYPERVADERRGSKWKAESKAAFKVLQTWLHKQSKENALRAVKAKIAELDGKIRSGFYDRKGEALAQAEQKVRQLIAASSSHGTKSKSLTLSGKARGKLDAHFRKIAGEEEVPWWNENFPV